MLYTNQILVSAIVLAGCAVGVAGCGQKGTLFLPTEPAAANRATLPQTLRSSFAARPAAGVSAPTPVTPVPVP